MSKNGGGYALPMFPLATYDFYKTNGSSHVVMPGGPSLTRQEFAEECDINAIMKRYDTVGGGPGGLPRHNDFPPFYADFSTMPTDLLGYMNLMHDAEVAFMMLPAVVRKEMDNDPMAFVEFASDPKNLDQMRKWGLAPVPAPEAPAPADGTPPAGGGPSVASPAVAEAVVPTRSAPPTQSST